MARVLTHLIGSVAVFSSTLSAEAAAPASSPGLEQDIIRLERDCNDAYAANNLSKYFNYYTDDAVLIFVNERTTVPAYRKMWTEEIKTKPLESVKLSDMVVRIMPAADAAIASYQIEIRTHQPGGRIKDEKFFETDVWVHKGEAWKLGHVHFSPISTG